MLPLLQAGSSIQSSLLANWSQYGLTLETAAGVTGPLLVPCLQYKPVGQRTGLASSEQGLHIFMMFEQTPASERGERQDQGEDAGERQDRSEDTGGGGENDQWVHLINMTAALKRNLVSLASIHSGKVFKAVHSTLNKLLCNYTSCAEVSVFSLAVPAASRSRLAVEASCGESCSDCSRGSEQHCETQQ